MFEAKIKYNIAKNMVKIKKQYILFVKITYTTLKCHKNRLNSLKNAKRQNQNKHYKNTN